jgi:hypothetical protein
VRRWPDSARRRAATFLASACSVAFNSAIIFAPAPSEKGGTVCAPTLLYGILLGFRYTVPEHPCDDFKVKCIGTSRYDERTKLLDFARLYQPRLVAQGF